MSISKRIYLLDLIKKNGHKDTLYIDRFEDILSYLSKEIKDGDAVVFLSAGDLTETAHSFSRFMEESIK